MGEISDIVGESAERKIAKANRAKGEGFEAAFLALQQELPFIPKSRDGYKFKYAPYEEIYRIAFPIMWFHGFSIRHNSFCENGHAFVRTILTYVKTGESAESVCPYELSAADQDRGKSLTYGKRYNTVLLLGLPIEGEPDTDDATTAKPTKTANKGESDF